MDDLDLLLDLACDASLDALDNGNPAIAATIHALHSIMRLGPQAASKAAPRLAKRALLLDPEDSQGDFMTEQTCSVLQKALTSFGKDAVEALVAQFQSLEGSQDLLIREDAWLGISIIMSEALVDIALKEGDIALCVRVGQQLHRLITLFMQARLLLAPANEARLLGQLVDELNHFLFLPELRTDAVFQSVRTAWSYIRKCEQIGGMGGNGSGFAMVCGSIGVEPLPGDPIIGEDPAPGKKRSRRHVPFSSSGHETWIQGETSLSRIA